MGQVDLGPPPFPGGGMSFPYGGISYRTPRLDELARTGVRFSRAYSQPLCTPTRLQLMTGKYNFRNWQAFGILPPNERTFAHVLKDAGYRTGIFGKWQLWSYDPPDRPTWRGKGSRPRESGFDEHVVWHAGHTEEKGSRYADPTVTVDGKTLPPLVGRYGEDVFVDALADFVRRNRDRPFFAYYAMALPHGPFMPTPDSAVWKDAGKRLSPHKDHFPDMVAYMDKMVGRVVDTLDAFHLREDTLLVFFSDNGTHQAIVSRMNDGRLIKGGKGLSTNAGIHVPLIVSWPGKAAGSRVVADLVDSTDFLPTFLDAIGGAPAACAGLDGRSFLPQVRGQPGQPRDWVFFHSDPRPGEDKDQFALERFALDGRFKLYEDGRLYDVLADPEQRRPLPPARDGEAERARSKLRAVLATLRPWSSP